MAATRREGASSGGRDNKRGWGICLTLLTIIITNLCYAQPAGWLRICKSSGCYYKPFVITKRTRRVFIITPEGRVYKAKCGKSSSHTKSCRATTAKRFFSSAHELLYIEVEPGYPPRLISHGNIDPLNVLKIYK